MSEFEKYHDYDPVDPYTADELRILRTEAVSRADELAAKKYPIKPGSREDYLDMRLQRQIEIESFRDKLLKEQERFRHIFKTELGSIYFVLHSGHCMRLLHRIVPHTEQWTDPPVWEYTPVALTENIFFTHDNVEVVEEQGAVTRIVITPALCAVGALPVEVGLLEAWNYPFSIKQTENGKIVVEVEGSEVTLLILFIILDIQLRN